MTKEEAIAIVEKELKKQGRSTYTVRSYSNDFYRKLFRITNDLRYRKRVPILRRIDFEKIVKPGIEIEDPLVINERGIVETSRFWIIPWNTNSFVNDFDLKGGLIGPGPFLIEKESKKLYATGAGMIGFIQQVKAEEPIDEEFL